MRAGTCLRQLTCKLSPLPTASTIMYSFSLNFPLLCPKLTNGSFAWNPQVGTDCSGLYIGYWVCVGIQIQQGITVTLSLGAPNATGTGEASFPPFETLTPTQTPTLDPSFEPTPYHGTPPSNCVHYYQARAVRLGARGLPSCGRGPWNTSNTLLTVSRAERYLRSCRPGRRRRHHPRPVLRMESRPCGKLRGHVGRLLLLCRRLQRG